MKKCITILLALIILLVNTGLTYSAHHCGDNVVNRELSFFRNDLGCGMVKERSNCIVQSGETQLDKKNCCNNEHRLLLLEEPSKLPSTLSFTEQLSVAFFPFYISPFLLPKTFVFETKVLYTPPLITEDISVLVQVFLV